MATKHLLANGKQDSDPSSGGNYGLAHYDLLFDADGGYLGLRAE
jgi:hypothetical protein